MLRRTLEEMENDIRKKLIIDIRESEEFAVESYPAKKPGWLMGKDFDSIRRLINVAVTRARGKLIVVANNTFWSNNYEGSKHTLYKLLQYMKENGIPLAGAVYDYSCPKTGKDYMFFPIRKR